MITLIWSGPILRAATGSNWKRQSRWSQQSCHVKGTEHDKDDGKALYAIGDFSPPHYSVPALNVCSWCGTNYNDPRMVCRFNGTGEWCADLCFPQ